MEVIIKEAKEFRFVGKKVFIDDKCQVIEDTHHISKESIIKYVVPEIINDLNLNK